MYLSVANGILSAFITTYSERTDNAPLLRLDAWAVGIFSSEQLYSIEIFPMQFDVTKVVREIAILSSFANCLEK